MKRNLLLITALTLLMLPACAGPSYIEVAYRLPPPEQSVDGRTVSLNVVDQRPEKSIAGPNAQKDLEYFTGLFSLYVEHDGQEPALVGAFELTELFKAALKQRLVSEGFTIIDTPTDDIPSVEIQIEDFVLDRDGKNWAATLAYKALASKNGKFLTSQSVTGEAQRLKIIGTRDAEKLLGEIFSDMINRLDPVKLFNHPDL